MGYGAPPPDWTAPGPSSYPPSGDGYGGPPGGGYGGPYPPAFPPPGPPRRNQGPLIALVAAFAVLLVAGATVLVVVTRHDGTGHPAAARTTAAAPPPFQPVTPSTPDSSTPSPTATPTPDNTFKPTVPGWQVVVASSESGLSYDVPADWKYNGEDGMIGLDDGTDAPETAVTYSSESRKDKCTLGGAGFRFSKVDDLTASALRGARLWANAAAHGAGSPHQSIGSPQNMTLKGGGRAKYITARVSTAPDSDNCGSTGTAIHIVVLPVDDGGSLLFVLYVHTGQPGALSDPDMGKLAHSVRYVK